MGTSTEHRVLVFVPNGQCDIAWRVVVVDIGEDLKACGFSEFVLDSHSDAGSLRGQAYKAYSSFEKPAVSLCHGEIRETTIRFIGDGRCDETGSLLGRLPIWYFLATMGPDFKEDSLAAISELEMVGALDRSTAFLSPTALEFAAANTAFSLSKLGVSSRTIETLARIFERTDVRFSMDCVFAGRSG